MASWGTVNQLSLGKGRRGEDRHNSLTVNSPRSHGISVYCKIENTICSKTTYTSYCKTVNKNTAKQSLQYTEKLSIKHTVILSMQHKINQSKQHL